MAASPPPSYFSCCRTRSGYAGTATYCRQGSGWTPRAAEDGVNGTWAQPGQMGTIGAYVTADEGAAAVRGWSVRRGMRV